MPEHADDPAGGRHAHALLRVVVQVSQEVLEAVGDGLARRTEIVQLFLVDPTVLGETTLLGRRQGVVLEVECLPVQHTAVNPRGGGPKLLIDIIRLIAKERMPVHRDIFQERLAKVGPRRHKLAILVHDEPPEPLASEPPPKTSRAWARMAWVQDVAKGVLEEIWLPIWRTLNDPEVDIVAAERTNEGQTRLCRRT